MYQKFLQKLLIDVQKGKEKFILKMINMVLESKKVQEEQYLNFDCLLENRLKGTKLHDFRRLGKSI